MQSIKEFLDTPVSPFSGSQETLALVSEQIKAKYGATELKNLDCYHNLRTFQAWKKLGWKIRKSEKAIRSITYVEKKDMAGNVIKRYRKPVFLFYYRQLQPEKIGPKSVC